MACVTGISERSLEQPANHKTKHNNAHITRTKFTPNKQTPPFEKTNNR